MSTITKTDMIKSVASATGISQEKTEKTIETFFAQVQSAIAAGQRVEFRGFGIWEVKIGKARIGRNPSDPEADVIRIPARPVLRFKAGKNLKAAINQNSVA